MSGGNKRRVLKLVLLFTVGVLLALVVAGAVLFKPMLRQAVIDAAAERGIALVPGDIGFGFSGVSVGRSQFSLRGVRGVAGRFESAKVSLSGFTPERVDATGVHVEAEGSAPFLALSVSEWTGRYPKAFKLPTHATDVSAVWRPAAGREAWLELSGGTVTPGAGSAAFRAKDAKVLGVSIGTVGSAFTADDAVIVLGFGEEDVSRSPVRIEVKHALPSPTADISLNPVDLKKLAAPMGVELPIDDVVGSGKAHLVFERGTEPKPITGTLEAKLQGYVPPHPRELDGFVFGDSTTLQSKLTVNAERTLVTLSETKVAAGAFKLAGDGSIQRLSDHARIKMVLQGSLPCDALAGAAAETHLGSVLGKMAGAAAKALLGGSVGVTVKLDADTRKLAEAKLERIIGVGCGLKPLDLSKLDLSKLGAGLPPLPSGLPPLPSGLPPLPSGLPPLPKLEVETKKAPPKEPAKKVVPKE